MTTRDLQQLIDFAWFRPDDVPPPPHDKIKILTKDGEIAAFYAPFANNGIGGYCLWNMNLTLLPDKVICWKPYK